MTKGFLLFFTVVFVVTPAIPLWAAGADQNELVGLLERMEASYATVQGYTALFHRRERIDGEWRPEERISLKFQKPFKVYMRWLSGSSEGREALYLQGVNDNKVLIHEAGGLISFFTFLLDPGGQHILEESRYPFTEIGIGRLIQRIAKDVRRAWARGEFRLVDYGEDEVYGREVRRMEGILPTARKAGYGSYRTVLAIDKENGLPIQASVYDWDNVITGEYGYSELRLNPGLSQIDFEPSNPAYHFSKWHISLSDGE